MTKRFKSQLDVALFNNLNEMFIEKNWVNVIGYESFLEKYYIFLENLNDDERALILELTQDYLWITQDSYLRYLVDALTKLEKYEYLNLDKIYIIPLLSKEDREVGKDKSSKYVSYQCLDIQLSNHPLFANTVFQRVDNLEHLPKETKIAGNRNPVILVDDYVGTGETAESALQELLTIRAYDLQYVFVASLVAQQIGINRIVSQGYNFLVSLVRNRGISDKYSPAEATVKKNIMLDLEKRIGVQTKYTLGYGESEGLITMIRTPNNSFPAYWVEPEDKKWQPPFPRKSR